MPAERYYPTYPYFYHSPPFTSPRAGSAYVVFGEREDVIADRRSALNALERQRREHLNLKYQELANALPNLRTVRRPSKALVVSTSLEFVEQSRSKEARYKSEILDLRKKNELLRKRTTALARSYPNLTPAMILSRIHHPQRHSPATASIWH